MTKSLVGQRSSNGKRLQKSSLYKVKQDSSTPEAVKFAGDKITSIVMDESDLNFTAYTDDNRSMLYKAKINSDKKEEVLENVDLCNGFEWLVLLP